MPTPKHLTGKAVKETTTIAEELVRMREELAATTTDRRIIMDVTIAITIEKVHGGFTVVVQHSGGGTEHGVATTAHGAVIQARKLVKELLEKIEPTIGKE